MNAIEADLPALVTYGAGGGFAAVFALLAAFFPQHQTQLLAAAATLVALCTMAAGVIRIFTAPSAPAGTVSAVVPIGSIPVVAKATDTCLQVAEIDPATVTHISPLLAGPKGTL